MRRSLTEGCHSVLIVHAAPSEYVASVGPTS